MGVADRGYMRGRGPPPIAIGASFTLRLVILVAAAFCAVSGARSWFHWRGAESLVLSRGAVLEGRWWTVVTAAFVHSDAWQLVFCLFGLWYFGKLCEETLGGAAYAAFVLSALLVSHACFLGAVFATGSYVGTVGASGIVMAMLVFAACKYPGMPFTLIVLPVALWQLALLYVAVAVWELTSNAGIHAATTVGGAALGYAVHRFGMPSLRLARRRRKPRAPGPYATGNTQIEIDRLLDKISREGIASLTDAEREFLRVNSGRYR